MLLRLAFKELRYSSAKLRVIFFILTIGFLGPLLTSALRSSVEDYLVVRSRQILSADIAVNSLRPFKDVEVQTLKEGLRFEKSAGEIEFVTMATGGAKGRELTQLVEVKAVDGAYPVLGAFRFEDGGSSASSQALDEERIAWVFPEVLTHLDLRVGDTVQLGHATFRIEKVVDEGPGLSRVGGFAPRVYIGSRHVDETGLTRFGSQVSYRMYLQLPPEVPITEATERVKELLPDPEIFVRTPDDSIRGLERFVKFFNLYLVSTTMIVFALAWVAAFYILQIFIQDRLKNAAVYMAVGASRFQTGLLYTIQIFALLSMALIGTILIGEGVSRLVPSFAGDILPTEFRFRIGLADIGAFVVVATASAVAFSLPLFVRLYSLRLQTLLDENSMGVERVSPRVLFLSYVPMVLIFLGLSVWLLESAWNALLLVGGLLATAFMSWWIGRRLFQLLFQLTRHRPGFLRLVSTHLSRSRFGVNLCFLTLLLVTIVLNLISHLLVSAVAEINPIQGRQIPALFLFNIPETSVEDLKRFAAQNDAELNYLSPMVLARLTKVNGEPPENDRFLRFPVRLSYRESPIPSEVLVEGREFSGGYDSESVRLPEVSMEKEFAERNKFSVGDVFEFDVQGLPVQGQVVNLRKVKWTTFHPNFFMVFQPGVLDDAPKTYIANMNIEAGDEARLKFQFEMTRQFPDLSVLDIGRTLKQVLEIVESVIGPVRAAAWTAVLMSFLILIGVISHNLKLRHAEVDIQKILGAESALVRNLIVSEYFVIAVFAVVFGSAAALVLNTVVTRHLLDIPTQVDRAALMASAVVTVLATSGIAWFSCARVLGLRGASRKL